MADKIHLQIVTAGGVVFDRMVHVVNLPLENGSIGVLENIDLARAEAAEKRARERLAAKNADTDASRAEAALHRAVARQHAAHMVKKHK